MTNLEKAKLKLLKLKKDHGSIIFDDVVDVAVEFGIDDMDQLTSFLEKRDIKIYESDEDAEEHGAIILWEEESDRFESLKKNCLLRAKHNNNSIDIALMVLLTDQYQLKPNHKQIEELMLFLNDNGITINGGDDEDDYDNADNQLQQQTTNKNEPNFYPVGCCFYVQPFYLKRLCSDTTFYKGSEYFRRGKVSFLKYGQSAYSSEVVGSNTYHVKVTFADGKIYSHECDCPAHENYSGPCKHVVATILFANNAINMDKIIEDDFGLPDGFTPIGDDYIDYEFTTAEWNKICDFVCEKVSCSFENDSTISEEEYWDLVNKFLRKYLGDYRKLDFSEQEDLYFVDELNKRNIKIWDLSDEDPGEYIDESYIEYDSYGYDDYDYEDENDYEVDNGYRDDYDYGED